LQRNTLAAPGLNPTIPMTGMSLMGMSPLGPLAGEKKPEKSKGQIVFPEASPELALEDSDAITSGLSPKAQFLISQSMQNRDFSSDARPVTPRSEVSYSQSFHRKGYLSQR